MLDAFFIQSLTNNSSILIVVTSPLSTPTTLSYFSSAIAILVSTSNLSIFSKIILSIQVLSLLRYIISTYKDRVGIFILSLYSLLYYIVSTLPRVNKYLYSVSSK